MSGAFRFTVPPELFASAPPEARGLARDEVGLLVAGADRPVRHRRFVDLPRVLRPGDLVVVNTSDTAPAAVDGWRADGRDVTVHVSGPVPDAPQWVVELRTPDGGRAHDGHPGERITLPGGVVATVVAAHPDPTAARSRLWAARIPVEAGVPAWLARVGRPIRYSYADGPQPLAAHRTVFAVPAPPGELASAEMPSAGRPFSHRVLVGLAARGVAVARIELHTGVSSLEAGETPLPERFRVPAATVAAVADARARGGRVVAVGTTVTRALESAAAPDGAVRPAAGWTDLVLGPDRPARVVDGLLTGWHEPEASHLLLLTAVAGSRLVARAYRAALAHGYRWHEFGDSCLLLPRRAHHQREHGANVVRRPR